MYSLLLLAATAASTSLEGQVVTDAKTHTGIVSIEAGNVIIDGVRLPFEKVRAVNPAPARAIAKNKSASAWLTLVGGSKLGVDGITSSADGETSIKIGDNELKIKNRQIKFVRFSPPDEKLDEQWSEFLAAERTGDTLVIRRPNSVLDRLEGVVNEVTTEKVKFAFDGDVIPVSLNRVDGYILFHGSNPSPLTESVCYLKTINGNEWNLGNVSLGKEEITGETVSGVALKIPNTDIHSITFSRSDSVYLSELEIAEYRWRPLIALPGIADHVEKLEAPRVDRGFHSEKLQLWVDDDGGRVESYDKGLAVTSRTDVDYRVRGQYRRLVAKIGIDAAYRNNGHVQLTILGDEKSLFDEAVSGEDAARDISVEIAGVKRLTIRVDYGKGLDVGDYLNLCEARLIK